MMSDTEKRWHVRYRIPDLTGVQVHRAGPYTWDDAVDHMKDIRGYEGVQVIGIGEEHYDDGSTD